MNKYIIYHSDLPSIEQIPLEIVNESSTVSLNRKIYSNPLANVYWYRGTKLLKTETSVKTATYIIERAMCTDTYNLTLQVNNVVGNVSVLVELIVNCKLFFYRSIFYRISCCKLHILKMFTLNFNSSKNLVDTLRGM